MRVRGLVCCTLPWSGNVRCFFGCFSDLASFTPCFNALAWVAIVHVLAEHPKIPYSKIAHQPSTLVQSRSKGTRRAKGCATFGGGQPLSGHLPFNSPARNHARIVSDRPFLAFISPCASGGPNTWHTEIPSGTSIIVRDHHMALDARFEKGLAGRWRTEAKTRVRSRRGEG